MASTERINLVQGDANVDVDFTITDKKLGAAVNLVSSTVQLFYRKVGSTALTATIACSYPGGGTDGVARATLTSACMASTGQYEGEIQITTGSKVQTINRKARFEVRSQIG